MRHRQRLAPRDDRARHPRRKRQPLREFSSIARRIRNNQIRQAVDSGRRSAPMPNARTPRLRSRRNSASEDRKAATAPCSRRRVSQQQQRERDGRVGRWTGPITDARHRPSTPHVLSTLGQKSPSSSGPRYSARRTRIARFLPDPVFSRRRPVITRVRATRLNRRFHRKNRSLLFQSPAPLDDSRARWRLSRPLPQSAQGSPPLGA